MKESGEETHDTPFKSVSNSQQQACFAGMYRGERSFPEMANDNQIEAQSLLSNLPIHLVRAPFLSAKLPSWTMRKARVYIFNPGLILRMKVEITEVAWSKL